MATNVIMPKAGMAMETGTILRWLKAVGDPVTAGEPLLEIQTDKVEMEVEAEISGYLLAILHEAGDEVAVTEPIALIGHKGEKPETGTAATPPQGLVDALARPSAHGPVPPMQPPTVTQPSTASSAMQAQPVAPPGKVMATPAARARARELGIALERVRPTGPAGEVRRRDVEVRRRDIEGMAARTAGGSAPSPASQPIPQLTLEAQADVTFLLDLLGKINARRGRAIGVNDLVMRMAASALADSPYMRQAIDGEQLIPHHDVNLGMAVALDSGPVVPVIHGADRLTLEALSRTSADLAARAREGRLSPEELAGGTFTVSDLGAFGIRSFTPLIRPSQGAALGVSAIGSEVYLEGPQPKERRVVALSLSVDPRAIDEAQAARFLQKLVALLQNPYEALL